MAIGIRLIAKLASPAREPEQLMKEMGDWLGQKCAPLLPEIKPAQVKGSPAIFCQLHPSAEEAELSLPDREHLVASASTSSVGPGYHLYLCALLKDWARDFHAAWQQPQDESGEYGDETGYFFSGDEQRVFTSMTGWLQNVANLFFDGTLTRRTRALPSACPPAPILKVSSPPLRRRGHAAANGCGRRRRMERGKGFLRVVGARP